MREDGFYWVKYRGEWMVLEWRSYSFANKSGRWIMNDYDLLDIEFERINESRLIPPED